MLSKLAQINVDITEVMEMMRVRVVDVAVQVDGRSDLSSGQVSAGGHEEGVGDGARQVVVGRTDDVVPEHEKASEVGHELVDGVGHGLGAGVGPEQDVADVVGHEQVVGEGFEQD